MSTQDQSLLELIQDIVSDMFVAGTGIALDYNDPTGKLVVTNTIAGGGGSVTTEDVQDIVAGLLAAGSGITLTYNDPGNQLTIAATGATGTPWVVTPTKTANYTATPGQMVPVDCSGGDVVITAAYAPGAQSGCFRIDDSNNMVYFRYETTTPLETPIYEQGHCRSAIGNAAGTQAILFADRKPFGFMDPIINPVITSVDHTLTFQNQGKEIRWGKNSAGTLTIPQYGTPSPRWVQGAGVQIVVTGTGQLTVQGSGATVINSSRNEYKSNGQHSVLGLENLDGGNTWLLTGDKTT